VAKGKGGGSFGAGSIVTLTADPAPSGKYFTSWTSATVTSQTAVTTTMIMPTNSVTVTAQSADLPSPTISAFQLTTGASNFTLSAEAIANQSWILKTSTNLIDWQIVSTNTSTPAGILLFTNQLNGEVARFYSITSP